VQEYIQEILENEVEVFLGRKKSERVKPIDGTPGYWNGHGKRKGVHRDEFDDERSSSSCKGGPKNDSRAR